MSVSKSKTGSKMRNKKRLADKKENVNPWEEQTAMLNDLASLIEAATITVMHANSAILDENSASEIKDKLKKPVPLATEAIKDITKRFIEIRDNRPPQQTGRITDPDTFVLYLNYGQRLELISNDINNRLFPILAEIRLAVPG